jgi:hypothetical protein
MAKGVGQMLFMFGVFMVLTVGSMYMFGVMNAESEAVNVSGTAYEDAYNSSMTIQNTSMSMVAPLGLLVFVVVIILGVRMLKR